MLTRKELKDLRRAAFAIGIGVTVGVYAGKLVNTVLDEAISAIDKFIFEKKDESPEETREYTEV